MKEAVLHLMKKIGSRSQRGCMERNAGKLVTHDLGSWVGARPDWNAPPLAISREAEQVGLGGGMDGIPTHAAASCYEFCTDPMASKQSSMTLGHPHTNVGERRDFRCDWGGSGSLELWAGFSR